MKSPLCVCTLILTLASGCAWGTNLREVRASDPTETKPISAPSVPLAQCTLTELERLESLDKGFWNNYPGNHQHVYQLRHDDQVERIAIYVPGAVWFLLPFPDITAGGELAFRPAAAPNQTTVEYRRGGWPWDPRSLDVLWPALQKCAASLSSPSTP
jgi:hypothetical protein